jgi:hypothetical protein
MAFSRNEFGCKKSGAASFFTPQKTQSCTMERRKNLDFEKAMISPFGPRWTSGFTVPASCQPDLILDCYGYLLMEIRSIPEWSNGGFEGGG